jgi:hypothetical protein
MSIEIANFAFFPTLKGSHIIIVYLVRPFPGRLVAGARPVIYIWPFQGRFVVLIMLCLNKHLTISRLVCGFNHLLPLIPKGFNVYRKYVFHVFPDPEGVASSPSKFRIINPRKFIICNHSIYSIQLNKYSSLCSIWNLSKNSLYSSLNNCFLWCSFW